MNNNIYGSSNNGSGVCQPRPPSPSSIVNNSVNQTMLRESKTRMQPTTARPFRPVPYTAEEHQRIQSLLDKVLGPEYVSFRPGGGGQKVSYIEGWKALNLANEIFGFNGWSSELISSQVDYFDTHGNSGRYSMGLSVVVRITIRDGTYHEDFGYGYIDNAKSKAMAFEKCRKEAFTDGVKRCLRCFGNVLGNCLYDRSIISKIQKVKLPPVQFEAEHFHRDPLIVERELKKRRTNGVNLPEKSETSNSSNANASGNDAPTTRTANTNINQTSSTNSVNTLQTPVSNKNFTVSSSTTQAQANITTNEQNQPPKQPVQLSGPSLHKAVAPKPIKSSSKYTPTTRTYDMVDDFDDSFVFSDDLPIDDDAELEATRTDGLDDYDMQMLLHKSREQGGTADHDDPILMARANIAQHNTTNDEEGSAIHHSTNVTVSNSVTESNVQSDAVLMPSNDINTPVQPALFVSAKKADVLQQTPEDAAKIPQFDTKFVSPNIRRTIDPNKSVPIKRVEVSHLVKNGANQSNINSNLGTRPNHRSSPINPPLGINSSSLGKRMIGLPPSQRTSLKRLHKDSLSDNNKNDQDSSRDKENQGVLDAKTKQTSVQPNNASSIGNENI